MSINETLSGWFQTSGWTKILYDTVSRAYAAASLLSGRRSFWIFISTTQSRAISRGSFTVKVNYTDQSVLNFERFLIALLCWGHILPVCWRCARLLSLWNWAFECWEGRNCRIACLPVDAWVKVLCTIEFFAVRWLEFIGIAL